MNIPPDPLNPSHEPHLAGSLVAQSPGTTHSRVDSLYGAACERGTTYEAVVHSCFCSAMDDEFGTDENAVDVAEAFIYARKRYGYLSSAENAQLDAENADDGTCKCGLDWLTCPSGCFEV
ncbi:hypothetical protein [Pseudomonas sp. MWU12-2323]|uniref:hypothetical protein n=1 Tax=Pseudomonas sp. MWU12-2323 TaxID=2651296 RepID=UPI00128B7B8C|nr:hypothetical protein [Pseudomonas sp. MWU12-2323]MPQ71461.1 hypothetical protein [Pseudomonas sp. MWU12-2323]